MAENPLLPDAELRALHALLKRAAKADSAAGRAVAKGRTRRSLPGGREGLLAGTLGQLRPGDLLLTEAADAAPAGLRTDPSVLTPELPEGVPQLLLSVAMAAALPVTAPRSLVLTLLRSGLHEPHWDRALAWAQDQRLALILACADPSGPNALFPSTRFTSGSMVWTALARVAARLKLPVLTVDGEDAVAVYRVMQESVLRARSGDGPAILWAVLPSPRELMAKRPASASPVGRLGRYLRTRKIAL